MQLLSRIVPRLSRVRAAVRQQFHARSPVGSSSAVAPVDFPQRGRGIVVADAGSIPDPQDPAFRSFARRCRRSARVDLHGAPVPSDGPSIIALAASGAPLHLVGEYRALADTVGHDLATAMRAEIEPGARGRELHSVRVRRAAVDARLPFERHPDVSVLLATVRPSDVHLAIRQARAQRGCHVQLVIGLHGDAWSADGVDLPVVADRDVVLRFDRSRTLGHVLGELTAAADAEHVTKWDDDDWYGRDHVADLLRARRYSDADVVGKAAEFVHLESSDVTIRRFDIGAESYTSTLAGGTLLTTRSWLDAVGGWPDVARGVDRALIDATRSRGGSVYRTHGFQYVLRRGTHAHTWSAPDSHFRRVANEVRQSLDLAFADIDAMAV